MWVKVDERFSERKGSSLNLRFPSVREDSILMRKGRLYKREKGRKRPDKGK